MSASIPAIDRPAITRNIEPKTYSISVNLELIDRRALEYLTKRGVETEGLHDFDLRIRYLAHRSFEEHIKVKNIFYDQYAPICRDFRDKLNDDAWEDIQEFLKRYNPFEYPQEDQPWVKRVLEDLVAYLNENKRKALAIEAVERALHQNLKASKKESILFTYFKDLEPAWSTLPLSPFSTVPRIEYSPEFKKLIEETFENGFNEIVEERRKREREAPFLSFLGFSISKSSFLGDRAGYQTIENSKHEKIS